MSQSFRTIDDQSETIALLQDDIARLETELAARDEALRNATIDVPSPEPSSIHGELENQLNELRADLDERDRLIVVLLEEGRRYEEAAEAQRQEWEQLSGWVEEVERRIEGKTSDGEMAAALDRERRETDEVRRGWASERRSWEAEKAAMNQEFQQLRERLSTSRGSVLSTDAAYLDRENQQLRASLQKAARHVTLAEEVGPLREQLAHAHAEIDRLGVALRKESDERRREAIENEAAIRSLQSKLARMPSEAPEPAPLAVGDDGSDAYREVDERIRAFRQHLRELHEREAAERTARSLTARLSRLWRHTGPA